MAESVYKVIELVGTSKKFWEKAAAAAVERAAMSVRELRVRQVVEQDLVIENGKVEAYRTKLKVSFKYEGKDGGALISAALFALASPCNLWIATPLAASASSVTCSSASVRHQEWQGLIAYKVEAHPSKKAFVEP